MVVVGKRLVMRYPSGNSFSFGRLRPTAPDAGIYQLAKGFEAIQRGSA